MSVELRDYQERAIAAVSQSFRTGHRAPILVAPTGAGKTVMGGVMCVKHLARSDANRIVWLAHRAELIEQAAQSLRRLGLHVGFESKIRVESIQTLVRRSDVPPATMVVYDECHHMASDEWGRLSAAWPAAFRIGLTATPERGDGRGLGSAFDDLVVAATTQELTDLGHLVPCRTIRPERMLKSSEIAQRPVDAWLEHASGRQTIVFCQNVLDAEVRRREFDEAGIRAALVTGETPAAERATAIDDFRAGRITVLVNVYVLTEGFDAPETSCCIIARGCGTAGMFLQIVGRVLRPAAGKADALLIDLRGVTHLHGEHTDPREYSLDGKGIRKASDVTQRFCSVCGAVFGPAQTVCEECGKDATSQLEAATVVGVKLVPYMHKRAESFEQRAKTLAKWVAMGRANGYKPGWAFNKYKVVYGCWPDAGVKAAAQ